MEQTDFSERDKCRLAALQKIANEMLDEELKDQRLKRWERILVAVALGAFVCIFFLPTGRGEVNFVTYFFFLLLGGATALFFSALRWKKEIRGRVEKEFFDRYGTEYKELTARRDEAEKNESGD